MVLICIMQLSELVALRRVVRHVGSARLIRGALFDYVLLVSACGIDDILANRLVQTLPAICLIFIQTKKTRAS